MSDFAVALVSLIVGDAGISALIGDRCVPVLASQTLALPYVSYRQISQLPAYSHDGGAPLRARYQIMAVASTYTGARALSLLLVGLLSGYSGSVGGIVVEGIQWQNTFDESIDTGDRSARRFQSTSDFLAFWR